MSRYKRTVVVCLAGSIALASCGNYTDEFSWEWAQLLGASEVFSSRDIPELVEASDAVIEGSFEGSCGERVIQGDAPADVTVYECLKFRIKHVLDGEGFEQGQSLPVEFIGQLPAEAPSPSGRALIFIVKKKTSNHYRAVNFAGFWVEDDNGKAIRPLDVDDHGAGSSDELTRLDWTDFTESLGSRLE